jgi:hypothetical protein
MKQEDTSRFPPVSRLSSTYGRAVKLRFLHSLAPRMGHLPVHEPSEARAA